LSITAVTGANLAKDRVLSLEDLGHNMTGISFTANSPQSNEINIRGVVNTRLSSPTSDQSVSTFVDDVYVGRSGNLNSAFYDIQRIEVVRGPQGVLLGKNVAGGAVNIISNAPSFERSGKFTVSLGNYDLRQTQGYFTGALTDEVAARVSFQTIHHGGYARDILHNVDIENLDSVQGRIQLAYQPQNSDLRASLNVDYSKDSNDGVNRVGLKSTTLPAGLTPWSSTRSLIEAKLGRKLSIRESFPIWPQFKGDASPTPQRAEHKTYDVIGKIEKDVAENIRLSSITGYRNNESFTLYDQTGLGPTNGYGVAAPVLFAEPVNFIESFWQFSQEVRLTSTNDDSRLDWIVGAYYQKSHVHQYNRFWGESTVLPTLSGESHWDDYGRNEDKADLRPARLQDHRRPEAGSRRALHPGRKGRHPARHHRRHRRQAEPERHRAADAADGELLHALRSKVEQADAAGDPALDAHRHDHGLRHGVGRLQGRRLPRQRLERLRGGHALQPGIGHQLRSRLQDRAVQPHDPIEQRRVLHEVHGPPGSADPGFVPVQRDQQRPGRHHQGRRERSAMGSQPLVPRLGKRQLCRRHL
jgi:hypothetical protein